jgi:hypothetical protein
MSGDYLSKKEVGHLLVPAVGRKIIDLGGNVEKGRSHTRLTSLHVDHACISLAPTFKLVGNSMILGAVEIMAEAYTLAEKSGISSDLVNNFIKGRRHLTAISLCSDILLTCRNIPCTWVRSVIIVIQSVRIYWSSRMMAYSDRMAHDNFDGSTGFNIEGGIKDATYVLFLIHPGACSPSSQAY